MLKIVQGVGLNSPCLHDIKVYILVQKSKVSIDCNIHWSHQLCGCKHSVWIVLQQRAEKVQFYLSMRTISWLIELQSKKINEQLLSPSLIDIYYYKHINKYKSSFFLFLKYFLFLCFIDRFILQCLSKCLPSISCILQLLPEFPK